ncbi:MAG: UbiD family decarboxylase [Thermoguttaceae bacterium]
MPHRTLADFLEELGRAGELAPVDAEVDPCLEVAEITRRVARQGGPALLFRCVKGHEIPLLTNLLGTESRICRALGVETIEEAIDRVDRLLNASGGEGWLERLRFGSQSAAVASLAANRVKSGACQQIVRLDSDVHLEELPCLQAGMEVKTPAIPSATILSAEPDSHAQVFLQGDVQIGGRDRLIAAWSDIAAASPFLQEYASRQARMPVAVVIGGDPAVHLAAAAPVPSAVDPLGLAGWLREKPLDAVAGRSVDLMVPAESDIIIEGYIDATDTEARTAARFSRGDRIIKDRQGHTIHVTAMTHRANRIFPAAISGMDCNEVGLRDRVMARVFLPLLKLRIPELVDFDLPLSGGARHVAFLAIHKTYAGQARHVATVAWGLRPLGFAKLLVVVDAEVDVRDADGVWAAIAHESHLVRDVWLHAAPSDPLDPTSTWNELGQRMAIDATRKLGAEGRESRPRNASLDRDIETRVTDRWAQYGLGPGN